MTCPCCQNRYRLTIREYMSLRNSHQCRSCKRSLKLRITAGYLLMLWYSATTLMLLSSAIVYWCTSDWQSVSLTFFGGAIAAAVCDYVLQSYWLKSVEDPPAAPVAGESPAVTTKSRS